tara:strand:- start:1183 stop:1509 length:327 start_codon:yes stop_codon:yes gene_type:complete
MMRNMAGMMKKMQEIQGQLAAMQEDFADKKFTAIVANGAVSATVTGDGKVDNLKLDPDALDQADTEMLEDMICLATNNALQKAAQEKTKMINNITGGLPLPPGLNLPF